MAGVLIDKTDFKFPGQKAVYRGKVRDIYDMGDSLLFVASDRYSAFDRNLALIPNKGCLITAITAWWFEQTKDIIKNHIRSLPDPNVIWGEKYRVAPVEVIVRGYITGVTNTSLWFNYSQGQRDFGTFTLPEGLRKNDKLPASAVTPTTKFEIHDRPLTPEDVITEKLVSKEIWQQMQEKALALFEFGQKKALERGLILVDTKYEFGLGPGDELFLIDEIHTPDSSRYWQADSYIKNIAAGKEPDNYDKEFLRLWYKERSNPYEDEKLPEPPIEIINELSNRYIAVYEQLSGNLFEEPDDADHLKRIQTNVLKALET
jgi:phosphoribosylaminoimidazole-succinocarboxamide synthase